MAGHLPHIMVLVFELLRRQLIGSSDHASLSLDSRSTIAPLNINFLRLSYFCLGRISICFYPIRSRVVFVAQIALSIGRGMQEVFVDVVFNSAVQLLRVILNLFPIDVLLIRDLKNCLMSLKAHGYIEHFHPVRGQFMCDQQASIIQVHGTALSLQLVALDLQHVGHRSANNATGIHIRGHGADFSDLLFCFLLIITEGGHC